MEKKYFYLQIADDVEFGGPSPLTAAFLLSLASLGYKAGGFYDYIL